MSLKSKLTPNKVGKFKFIELLHCVRKRGQVEIYKKLVVITELIKGRVISRFEVDSHTTTEVKTIYKGESLIEALNHYNSINI